jgi:hypothetical protein
MLPQPLAKSLETWSDEHDTGSKTIVAAVPTHPELGDRLAMLGPEPETTLRLSDGEVADFAPAALESVTVTVKVIVPAVVGAPERTPAELSDRPLAGRPVAVLVMSCARGVSVCARRRDILGTGSGARRARGGNRAEN